MRQVQTHLVNVATNEPLPLTEADRTCHVEKQENSWTLYIQHDYGGRKHHSLAAKAVNEIMDGCLKGIGELGDMLSCDSPSQIPGVLKAHDVPPDYSEEGGDQLGLTVPNVYHYLMIQNPLCNFKEGDRVAYSGDQGKIGGKILEWGRSVAELVGLLFRAGVDEWVIRFNVMFCRVSVFS